MENPAKLHAISGDNAEASLKRILELAAAAKGQAKPGHPLASPEVRKLALKALRAILSESREGAAARAAVRGILDGFEQLSALATPEPAKET